MRGELLTRTIVSVVGSLSSVGGHKVRVVGPSAEGIMVFLVEVDLQGIAKGLRTRGIVAALQGKRTRKRNGASQASDLGMSVTPRHTHTHIHKHKRWHVQDHIDVRTRIISYWTLYMYVCI